MLVELQAVHLGVLDQQREEAGICGEEGHGKQLVEMTAGVGWCIAGMLAPFLWAGPRIAPATQLCCCRPPRLPPQAYLCGG